MNTQTVALLQEIVRRESLTMLNYVGDSFPWTTSRGLPALARLQEIVQGHRDAVGALGHYLTLKRYPLGYVGSYPAGFTTLNFVSLDFLLPRLAADEARGVALLEKNVAAVADPDAKAELEKLLAVKREHQQTLELLAAEHNKPLAG